jgi:hypothetical protein
MTPAGALFLANVLSGVHLVLIFYFLVGWLIPFTGFVRRCAVNLVVGGSFFLFSFVGGCPLTAWESNLRQIADPAGMYGNSFIARQATQWFNIALDFEAVRQFSWWMDAGILLVTAGCLLWVLLVRRRVT